MLPTCGDICWELKRLVNVCQVGSVEGQASTMPCLGDLHTCCGVRTNLWSCVSLCVFSVDRTVCKTACEPRLSPAEANQLPGSACLQSNILMLGPRALAPLARICPKESKGIPQPPNGMQLHPEVSAWNEDWTNRPKDLNKVGSLSVSRRDEATGSSHGHAQITMSIMMQSVLVSFRP